MFVVVDVVRVVCVLYVMQLHVFFVLFAFVMCSCCCWLSFGGVDVV